MSNWEITYPEGLVKYVDFFRNKCFQYEIYDKVVKEYIDEYSKIPVAEICSLGCGTGRNELQFSKMGYTVTGIERNAESLPILENLFEGEKVPMFSIVEADFMKAEELKANLDGNQFDCIVMLSVPLSIDDVKKSVILFEPYLKPGGLIIAPQYFGYDDGFVPQCTLSECDFADNPFQEDCSNREFCVRLNIYKYRDSIIDWTAVYIYYDKNHVLQMNRDHDIIEVLQQNSYVDTLRLDSSSSMELLPIREITECTEEINFPKTSAFIVAWRKKDE